MGRYEQSEIESFTRSVLDDGYCILRGQFPADALDAWREAFAPMLVRHTEHEGHLRNRGPGRYYVTLPFTEPFADPAIYEDEDARGGPEQSGSQPNTTVVDR
jgi:hypothetical protein